MGIAETLSGLALGPVAEAVGQGLGGRVVEGLGGGLIGALASRFTDQSQRLGRALSQAHARAWKALEIALAGDSFWEKCRARFGRAEDQAFRAEVRRFLDSIPADQLPRTKEAFRRQCLAELRAARKGGLLTQGSLSPQRLAKEAGTFAGFRNPEALLKAEREALAHIGEELQAAGYEQLGQLLAPREGPSLLVLSARYFLRRAVEEDGQLFQGLAFSQLENLGQGQEQGFAALQHLLGEQGERLEAVLGDVQAIVVETHAAVLDVREELQGQGEQNRAIYQAVMDLQRRFDLMQAAVRPRDTMSVRSDAERRLVRDVIKRYRSLPEQERDHLPALLNAVGQLELAAGDFEEAARDFSAVAGIVQEPGAQAEAHYNAYRAALERRDWAAALQELRQAMKLDAPRFAPLPLAKYYPIRILGAGGYGVAFLCQQGAQPKVVVKTLLDEELDCGMDQLFAEARTLRQLNHPGIVHAIECGYTVPEQHAGPFLVMEYFEGTTLEHYIQKHGPLPLPQWMAVARQVAEALAAAHRRNILHRDVKPANLLVRAALDGLRAQVIDFGLALRQETLRQATQQSRTLTGMSIAGTLEYAAPEQMGKRPGTRLGPYSDVYGFGKTFCYALFQTTQPVLKHWQSVPPKLADLLGRCLAEDPAERFSDFTEVLTRLERLEAAARPAARPEPPRKSRHWTLTAEDDRRSRRDDEEERSPRRSRRQVSGKPGEGIPTWIWALLAVGGVLGLVGLIVTIVLLPRSPGKPTLPDANNPGAAQPNPTSAFGSASENRSDPWEAKLATNPNPRPATPLPPELRPSVNDPEKSRVYLSDLEVKAVGMAPMAWKYGKNGYLGYPAGRRIHAFGWLSEKGLGMHPVNPYSWMRFEIPASETFVGWAGIDDSGGGLGGGDLKLTFEVRGDNKQLWKSKPVNKIREFQECRVSVKGVKVLELCVYPPAGSIIPPHGGHAVWLDPYVTRANVASKVP